MRAAALALMLSAAVVGRARAAGFASAEFGGEQGNVVASNPTALYYNPAGIAFASGTSLYADGVLALRRGSWEHAPAPTDAPDPTGAEGANAGRARFFNAFGAPMLGATTRLGRLALGGALYVPFGGRISWDRNDRFTASPSFPLAAGGPQRWTIIDGALTYLTFTVGAAYRFGRVSVGLTGNVVRSSVAQTQAKNPTGLGDPDSGSEGRDRLDVSGIEGSFGAGLMVEAVPDRLWLGLSYQAQPGLGAMKLHGTLDVTFQGDTARFPVTLTQALPDVVRFGVRFRPVPAVELRLYGDRTRWSALEAQCIGLEGHACAVSADGSDATADASTIENLRRSWKDTSAIRAGVSVWPRPSLELLAGLGYETAATPDATLDTALPDADSVRLALGGRLAVSPSLFVAAGLTAIPSFARDNGGKSTLADAQLPTRRADAGGKYTLWLGLVNLNVERRF